MLAQPQHITVIKFGQVVIAQPLVGQDGVILGGQCLKRFQVKTTDLKSRTDLAQVNG